MVFHIRDITGSPPARGRAAHAKPKPPWYPLYKLARWNNPKYGLRIRVLTRDLFTCTRCGLVDHSSRLHAHHIVPHKGNPDLFWSINNITTLCEDCHNLDAAQVEYRGYSDALDNQGYPIDPRHPANQKGGLLKRRSQC